MDLLAEQILLVALDDATGRDVTRWASEAGLAAALLLDLGRRDLLRTDVDKKLVAVDGVAPGHEPLRLIDKAVPKEARGTRAPRRRGRLERRSPGRLRPGSTRQLATLRARRGWSRSTRATSRGSRRIG